MITTYATYCPEDDKLRLYCGRVPREEYERLRKEGWTSTPKQDCDFVAVWTPKREDTAFEYSPEGIEDEDAGPEERAADRAERFAGYADKRAGEAHEKADAYDAGPALHGYQNAALAERRAARHDMQATRAVNQWEKAEYWQRRTASVISHALHKSSPGVRMGRIKTLEAEQRKSDASREKHRKYWNGWKKVSEAEGADVLLPLSEDGYADTAKMNETQKLAYALAGLGEYRCSIMHPDEEANENGRRVHGSYFFGFSAYDFLTHDRYGGAAFRRLTPKEYADHYLSKAKSPETYGMRWANHYALRLAYENQMLEAQGGRAAFVEMEPGGWIAEKQILKVNKSHATGRVVSVNVMGFTSGYTAASGYKEYARTPCEITLNIERLPEGVYRPPTDEERAAFKAAKAAKPKGPTLINPTPEDARRLQDLRNRLAYARTRGNNYPTKPGEVEEMEQGKFSSRCADYRGTHEMLGGLIRLRVYSAYGWQRESGIVVLTDKPQKPIPAAVFQAYEAELAKFAKPAEKGVLP